MVITGLILPGMLPEAILKVCVWILKVGVPTAEAVSIILFSAAVGLIRKSFKPLACNMPLEFIALFFNVGIF
jgi:hypothetical protein